MLLLALSWARGGGWGRTGRGVDSLKAALAQLGERQTEDLKVPGSIPGGGTLLFFVQSTPPWPNG